MPRYITAEAVQSRLGELGLVVLADRANKPGSPISIARAIADAESYVDLFIGASYPLPLEGIVSMDDPALNTVPGIVVAVTVDIAVRNLARYDAGLMSDTIREVFAEAKEILGKIQDRKVVLSTVDDRPAARIGATATGQPREYAIDQTDGLV